MPCAWRFPGLGPRWPGPSSCTAGSPSRAAGSETQRGGLGAVERDAGPPRGRRARSATSIPTSSSTPTRPTSASGSPTPAGAPSSSPPPAPIHHDQMASDAGRRRAPHGRVPPQPRPLPAQAQGPAGRVPAAPAARLPLPASGPLAALVLPGRSAGRFAVHARQALRPGSGEGIREAAEAYNRRLGSPPAVTTPGGR